MGESFLDLGDENLDAAIEPQAVENGEYTVKIADWKTDKKGAVLRSDTNGNPYIMPLLEVIECEEAASAKSFSQFLRIPHDGMDAKEKNGAKYALKEFCTCFGIDYTQRVDYEECIGMTGEALLIVTPDEGYGEQNKVKKFLSAR